MADTSMTFIKRLADTALGMILYAPIALCRLFPYRWRLPLIGWITAYIVAPLAGYNRRVRDNLAHVMPDLPGEEVRALMRKVPDHAGRNLIELFSPRNFTARAARSPVEGPGLPTIRTARKENRPVIFVTGHFGSFNAARVAMITQGFDMGVFYRPLSNAWFNRRYTEAMAALSEPMFEQGRSGMVQMVRHLRRGGVLAILTDLNTQDGAKLDFFGKPALTGLTTAELALKFEAPLVPVWAIRDENGLDFHVHVEEPIPASDAVTMTQEINDRLEAQVRENMEQWFWIHRRWKGGSRKG